MPNSPQLNNSAAHYEDLALTELNLAEDVATRSDGIGPLYYANRAHVFATLANAAAIREAGEASEYNAGLQP